MTVLELGCLAGGSALAEGISQDLFFVNEREIRRGCFGHKTELNRSRPLQHGHAAFQREYVRTFVGRFSSQVPPRNVK